ncbi:MAG TPA: indole-3-glycerol phosphate synthase TrpC [Polyangiaceae bacterium]
MGTLDRILAQKRSELAALRKRTLPHAPSPRPVPLKRVAGGPLNFIAEIKRRSPSAGQLSTALSVGERAAAYERAGATMISVLCDQSFFDGAFEHLAVARRTSELPLLCKDFVLDEVQLDCALAFGADAVLLIVRCLDDTSLAHLFEAATARQLLPLVEVATDEEARRAVAVGATTIGVNARDLDSLAMDPGRAALVLANLPNHITKLHLSGISSPADVARISSAAADAALIGEVLMRQDDPEPLLRSLITAAAPGAAPR